MIQRCSQLREPSPSAQLGDTSRLKTASANSPTDCQQGDSIPRNFFKKRCWQQVTLLATSPVFAGRLPAGGISPTPACQIKRPEILSICDRNPAGISFQCSSKRSPAKRSRAETALHRLRKLRWMLTHKLSSIATGVTKTPPSFSFLQLLRIYIERISDITIRNSLPPLRGLIAQWAEETRDCCLAAQLHSHPSLKNISRDRNTDRKRSGISRNSR